MKGVPPQVKEQGNRMPATQPAVTISDDAVKYVLSASGKEADTRNVPDDISAGKYYIVAEGDGAMSVNNELYGYGSMSGNGVNDNEDIIEFYDGDYITLRAATNAKKSVKITLVPLSEIQK